MSFTITDLKKHLGPGLGLRKSKYLIEIPVPGVEGKTIDILCRSAGLPERNIRTVSTWHKGRQYNQRAETDYVGTYEISIVDSSDMSIRKMFDIWLERVDKSKPKNSGILGASFESSLGEIKEAVGLANNIKTFLNNPGDVATDFFLGFLDPGNANTTAVYQTEVNIWQLDGTGNKVYGYKLQNCFPSNIGVVTLDDGEENTLSEFSVVFTFSELIPLEGISNTQRLINGIVGDEVTDIFRGVESLFD